MKELDDAIYAAYAASTLATTPLITAMYNTEAPDDAVFPYGVFQLVNGKADNHSSNKTFSENMLLQFNLFDKRSSMGGATGMSVIYAALILAYDFTALTVGGYDALSCVRENTLQIRQNKVWQINVTYRIMLRKL